VDIIGFPGVIYLCFVESRIRFLVFFLFLFSSFSGSCLVSSSLSGVWWFKFECCPQVPESALKSTSCPALELGYCWACLLGACFFASPPFSRARSVICQLAPCYQHVVMACCLFLNFAEPVDFGCCSLDQEMSFVDHYLPYFRQWLITHPLSACLSF
jgi:hypothetical protein